MKRSPSLTLRVSGQLLPLLLSAAILYAEPPDLLDQARLAAQQQDAAVLKALQETRQAAYHDTPLVDFLDHITKLTGIRVVLETTALEEEGIAADSPITLVMLKPMPYSHILNRVLPRLSLTWWPENGEIVVSTQFRGTRMLDTRVYPIGNLLQLATQREAQLREKRPRNSQPLVPFSGPPQTAEELLIEVLHNGTSGPWHPSDEEGGTLKIAGENLIVRQTWRTHGEVAALLRTLESARQHGDKPAWLVTESDEQVVETVRLLKQLDHEVEVNFTDMPLSDVVTYLADYLEEEIFLDVEKLNEEGIATDTPVTYTDRCPARTALRRILQPLALHSVIDDGAVRITTEQTAAKQTVVYNIAELIRPDFDDVDVITKIQEMTSGPWFDKDAEGGTIANCPGGLLVIRQRPGAQAEIALLLHDLRQARTTDDKPQISRRVDTVDTRIYKAASKSEAESLERLILTFVAPRTWDVSGGPGRIRSAEDRLVIEHSSAIHQQIEQFLRDYQYAQPIEKP